MNSNNFFILVYLRKIEKKYDGILLMDLYTAAVTMITIYQYFKTAELVGRIFTYYSPAIYLVWKSVSYIYSYFFPSSENRLMSTIARIVFGLTGKNLDDMTDSEIDQFTEEISHKFKNKSVPDDVKENVTGVLSWVSELVGSDVAGLTEVEDESNLNQSLMESVRNVEQVDLECSQMARDLGRRLIEARAKYCQPRLTRSALI